MLHRMSFREATSRREVENESDREGNFLKIQFLENKSRVKETMPTVNRCQNNPELISGYVNQSTMNV